MAYPNWGACYDLFPLKFDCVVAGVDDVTELLCSLCVQATIGIDFLSKTMYLEDRTVSSHPSHKFDYISVS